MTGTGLGLSGSLSNLSRPSTSLALARCQSERVIPLLDTKWIEDLTSKPQFAVHLSRPSTSQDERNSIGGDGGTNLAYTSEFDTFGIGGGVSERDLIITEREDSERRERREKDRGERDKEKAKQAYGDTHGVGEVGRRWVERNLCVKPPKKEYSFEEFMVIR